MMDPLEPSAHEATTPYCQRCDRACERSAQLVASLKRTARDLHVALGHPLPAHRWIECPDEGCQRRWAICEGRVV